MWAGRLRDRIRIERYEASTDATGAPVKNWSLVCERQASIQTVSGREYFAVGHDVSESVVRIAVRGLGDTSLGLLDGRLRAIDVDRGEVFDITAVLPSRLRQDVTLVAKRGGSKEA